MPLKDHNLFAQNKYIKYKKRREREALDGGNRADRTSNSNFGFFHSPVKAKSFLGSAISISESVQPSSR
ncbi:UNVERIFIED_CONTAM: hypothetical protein NCL1_14337 [Trichonephila clavipes]